MVRLLAPRKEAEIRALLARWKAAKMVALHFMNTMNYSQRGLACLLQVDCTSLGRFLSTDMDSAPCSTRPAMLRILEKVEKTCTIPEFVTELPLDALPCRDDDGLWARAHTHALRHVRRDLDPGRGLGGCLAVLGAQAIHGPATYRSHMCTHVLLTTMHLLFRLNGDRELPCSQQRLQTTVERIDRLEQTALDGVAQARGNFRSARAVGYASSGRGYAGLLLANQPLIDAGARGMLRAAASSHEPRIDKLWLNALTFVEKLLERKQPSAVGLAQRAFDVAHKNGGEGLRDALQKLSVPRLLAIWRRMDLMCVVRQTQGDEE